MGIALNDEVRRLLDGRHFAVLATINPAGAPQTSAMWVARDGDDVLFSTVAGRRKHRNLERDPRATVTLIGPCPRCSHQMSVELPIKARIGRGVSVEFDGESLGRKSFSKVAFCNCGAPHEGRPDDCPDGCGAFGALLVGGPEQPTGERCVSVTGQPKMAAIHDVEWERKAETEASQTLTSARGAAEKWTQTITSLTGVFSIVLLVKGPEDITKVQGNVDAFNLTVPSWLMWTAAGVAAACVIALVVAWKKKRVGRNARWALLGTAIVIVAALVALSANSWSHFTLIVVLLSCAVVLAATSIISGGLASFGLPSGFVAASGAILRQRQTKQTLPPRSLLRGSLYAAALTLAVVGAAIALTWTQTSSATPDPVMAILKAPNDGEPRVLCGEMSSTELPAGLPGLALAVDTSDGKEPPETVPVAEVDLLATVSSCGSRAP